MFWLGAKCASVFSSILLSFFPSKSFVFRRIKFTSFMKKETSKDIIKKPVYLLSGFFMIGTSVMKESKQNVSKIH